MITKERIAKAKAKLEREAAQINDHIARVRAIADSGFLEKHAGKVVNGRFHALLARAYGCEEKVFDGKPWFPDTSFEHGYMPAPLTGRGVPQLCVDVCKGWGSFEIPLVCDYNQGEKLNAKATREAWEKILELRQKWADKQAECAKLVAKAAAKYNKIEEAAVALVKWLGDGPDGSEITTLCAFGGDIYDRVNPFRWHEKEKEVE